MKVKLYLLIMELALLAPHAVRAQCSPPPSGIVAWWPGNGNALDIAGGNNGTLVGGVTFTNGEVGQAFNFDGVSGYVDIPNSASLNPTGPFSVECWVKASPVQYYSQVLIVDKSHGFTDGTGWALQTDPSGKVDFFYGIGGPTGSSQYFPYVSTSNSVLDNHWHHLAGVWTGTQLQIYEDGVLQNLLNQTNLPASNFRDVEFGSSWGGGARTRYFNGQIDEVSYYNAALSSNDIAAIYAASGAGKCGLGGCVAPANGLTGWWKGDGNALDSAGTNNGTLFGNTTYAPGMTGLGFLCDGNNGGVQLSNTPALQLQNLTIAAWVRRTRLDRTSASGTDGEILAGGNQSYALGVRNDGRLFFSKVNISEVTTAAGLLVDTNFHHVAVTRSGSDTRFYLDGQQVSQASYSDQFVFSTPLAIGSVGDTHAGTIDAVLDDIRVYDHALTYSEVQSLVCAGSSIVTSTCTNLTFPIATNIVVATSNAVVTNGLVGWWLADGNANDSFGTNNGALVNAAGYGSGESGQAFSFQPNVNNPQYVNVGGMDGLDGATGITVAGYIKFPSGSGPFHIFSLGEWSGPANTPCGSAFLDVELQFFLPGANVLGLSYPSLIEAGSNICTSGGITYTNLGLNSLFSYSPNVTIPTNQWVHAAMTWDRSSGTLITYLNGTALKTNVLNPEPPIPPTYASASAIPPGSIRRLGPAVIGAGAYVSGGTPTIEESATPGLIDTLRVYSRVLSSSEIQQIMQADSTAIASTNTEIITTNLEFCAVTTIGTGGPSSGGLQILNASPGQVQLFWPSQTNAWYLLEGSDELAPLNWFNVWGPNPGNASNVMVLDPITARPHRFYRLLSTQ